MLARVKRLFKALENLAWSRRAYRFHMREWTRLTDLDGAAQLLNTVRFSRTLVPVEMEAPSNRRITVIAPHPDDEAIGPGGTLLMATARGCTITVIYVTDGTAAEHDIRIQESAAVCKALGWRVVRLGGVAGMLDINADMAKKFTAVLAETQPDIVMLPFVLDDNDDHRRTNELWLTGGRNSAVTAEVWAYQVYSVVLPNVVVDITEVQDGKAALIRDYKSQMRRRDWANFALGRDAWTSRWLPGRNAAAWAEAFHVVPAADYLDYAAIYFQNNRQNYYR